MSFPIQAATIIGMREATSWIGKMISKGPRPEGSFGTIAQHANTEIRPSKSADRILSRLKSITVKATTAAVATIFNSPNGNIDQMPSRRAKAVIVMKSCLNEKRYREIPIASLETANWKHQTSIFMLLSPIGSRLVKGSP
jgi:hypothetical protein